MESLICQEQIQIEYSNRSEHTLQFTLFQPLGLDTRTNESADHRVELCPYIILSHCKDADSISCQVVALNWGLVVGVGWKGKWNFV